MTLLISVFTQYISITYPTEAKWVTNDDMKEHKKTKNILWIVSHCQGRESGRLTYARQLEKETQLEIDIFGEVSIH